MNKYLMLVLLVLVEHASASKLTTTAEYVGSIKCASCHAEAYRAWQKSHHWQAMQPVNEQTVLGDFNNASFSHFGVTSRFYKKDQRYFVKTDNANGKLQEFELKYTFGFYPLQQYLIEFPDGRYQALSVAWDSRDKKQGGQRWFHLYPDQQTDHNDPLHWTGAYQNWNSRCAECHSTNLKKNYTQQSNRYKTTWDEVTVGCEACHGPASGHIDWSKDKSSNSKYKGFSQSLAERGTWQKQANSKTLQRSDKKRPVTQIELCARCHSRRMMIDEDYHGKSYLDANVPSLLTQNLYYPDGQIQDEVYVYGSFLQSKMYRKGVVCSDCHEVHGTTLKTEGNLLCTRCHDNATFDSKSHHHHKSGSPGSACINCHMPETTYMVVDPRRDHSMRIPDPALSVGTDIPNACNGCHKDKTAKWAMKSVNDWTGSQDSPSEISSIANSLQQARNSQPLAAKGLRTIVDDPEQAAIVRATALDELGRFPDRNNYNTAVLLLLSDNDLVRLGAVRSLEWLPSEMRYISLRPLQNDKSKAVRMAVARALSQIPPKDLRNKDWEKLQPLFNEYLDSLKVNADMPSGQTNIGLYYAARGDYSASEKAYQRALKLSPHYITAMINLADLYRATNRDDQAQTVLERALAVDANQAPVHHAMGLLWIRKKNMPDAISSLKMAAELEPQSPQYTYVYSVALENDGKINQAISVLEKALPIHSQNKQLVLLLAEYYKKNGDTKKLEQLIQKYQ